MAAALNQKPDEFLGLAGRLPSDLPDIIRKHPEEYTKLLRSMRKLNGEQLRELAYFFAFQRFPRQPFSARIRFRWDSIDRDGLKKWILPGDPDQAAFNAAKDSPVPKQRSRSKSTRAEKRDGGGIGLSAGRAPV